MLKTLITQRLASLGNLPADDVTQGDRARDARDWPNAA